LPESSGRTNVTFKGGTNPRFVSLATWSRNDIVEASSDCVPFIVDVLITMGNSGVVGLVDDLS
jgi:hypothetical protein